MNIQQEFGKIIKDYCEKENVGRFNVVSEIVKQLYDESYEVIITSPAESPQTPQNESESNDAVINHPSHYKLHAHECIEEIRALLTPEEFRGYLKGCFLKYRYRAGAKGDAQVDFDKSDKYMDWLMDEG